MTTGNKLQASVSRKIIYILSCMFLAILIAAMLMPKQISTKIIEEIDSPKSYVFNLLNNQKSVSTWNAWLQEDKDVRLEYIGASTGNGSGYKWESRKIGKGDIQYIEVKDNEKIKAEITVDDDKSNYTQKLSEHEGKTTLEWEFNTYMAFPKNVFAPWLKYSINKHNRRSVENMRKEIEMRKKGKYHGYDVREIAQNQRYFIISRNKVSFDNIASFYAQNLSAIYQKLSLEGITATAAPCALFYEYDEQKMETDMAVAVPVLQSIAVKDLQSVTIPSGNAAYVDYYGNSAEAELAHYALDEYIKDRNFGLHIPVIEEYVTDPLKEKDQTKWLTKIYYIIKPITK
jgi:effector-binding domain-containing protein/uncharacterized protein YndB with AHSA1/START domain